VSIRLIKKSNSIKTGWFGEQLDEFLTTTRFQYPRDRIIRPSEITDCIRKQVMSILQFPCEDYITAKQQRIFDMGNFVHKRYLRYYIPRLGCALKIDIFQRGKWSTKDFIEISIRSPEYWLKGSPDAVIINRKDGLPYIFELKSIKQELFNTLIEPDENYKAQVHMYMFMTKIHRAIVYYENKNNQERKEFEITFDQELIDQLLQKIRSIQKYVLEFNVTKQLPKCECGRYNDCKRFKIPKELQHAITTI